MQGAVDEASLRLARALQQTPEHVEAVLQEVGVDAPYLERALLEGDPQGAIDAVSRRLGVAPRDLAVALVRSSGVEDDPARLRGRSGLSAEDAARAEALEAFLSTRLPRILSRAAFLALLGGLALGAFAALALVRPEIFRALLVYAMAGAAGLGSLVLLVAAWRMRRSARALRRKASRDLSTKR